QPGDVLFCVRGSTTGRMNWADREYAIGRGVAAIRHKTNPALQPFVRAVVEYGLPGLLAQATGSTFPNVSADQLAGLWWPPTAEDEQRAIAHILGTLDDKIELNRRMNETLEAMARALFKSWFVDFDPVRAKAEGRDPGSPQPSPTSSRIFEDSELGEIPRGWEVKSLDEIARFLNGLALQKYPPTNGKSLPVIKISQLRAGNAQGADQASADLAPDYVVADGDVLFSWSGSLECVLWAGGRGALNQHLFKVTSTTYPKWLYYLWIHQHLADFRHIAASKATTMGHIQRHHLSGAKAVIPGFDLLAAADLHLGPLIDSIPTLLAQSRHLGVVRDELLPNLVSGAVRIESPEAFSGTSA
ncbi:MAG: restriction endonuclease subunit S, partial [Candidatus Eisenbacteria bacterium]|nr:restriction endonuclease subunit S [Candidatus Eisenbacteria bacterium]